MSAVPSQESAAGPPPTCAPAAPESAAAAPACLNCGLALEPADARFCPHCGQHTRPRPPTVGEFLHELAGSYLAVEGPLWRTLKTLLMHPGELTRAYLAGRRLHYVRPLRLYLTISLVVLLALGAALNARLATTLPGRIDVTQSRFMMFDFAVARAGLDQGRFVCEGLPAALCQRLERRALQDPEGIGQLTMRSVQRASGHLGAIMFVLLPVFALLLRLAWAGGRWRLAEHLVFALHVHAFWFLALAVTLAGLPWLSLAAGMVAAGYALWAARRVYGGSWMSLLARSAAVASAYGLLLAFTLAALTIWALAA